MKIKELMNKKALIEIEENGKKLNPILQQSVKNYLIDNDGTICDDIPNDKPTLIAKAILYPEAIVTFLKWFEESDIITFFTSHTKLWGEVKEKWFIENGFLYHGLLIGKPRESICQWIDNHMVSATKYADHFTNLLIKEVSIEVFKN
jgi:uncharacterized HAD superfamily protein